MAEKEKQGIFGKKKPIPPPVKSSGKELRELKVLENRISNIDHKTELIENNLISSNKKQNVEIKTVHSQLLEMEKDITLIKRRIREIASEFNKFARKDEVDTLRKYLDMWQPLNFVSRKEVEEMINEKFK